MARASPLSGILTPSMNEALNRVISSVLPFLSRRSTSHRPALAAIAVGGVAYVFLLPLLSGEKRAEQRMKDVAQAETVTPCIKCIHNEYCSIKDLCFTMSFIYFKPA